MFYLAQLPNEILLHIFGFLGPSDLLPCGLVCRHWQSLSNHESLWRHLCNSLHGPCRRHSCRSTQLTRLVGANCVGDVCAKQHFWAISWARNSIPMGSINTIDSLEENIIHKLVKKRETSGFPTTNRCHWAVQCLLDHGLNADHRNMQGRSPAHLAASIGDTELLRMLYASRSEAHRDSLCNQGFSPLHISAMEGNLPCLQLLVDEMNCQSTTQTASGRTILHLAAQRGHADMVAWILKHPSMSSFFFRETRDQSGSTALMLAAKEARSETVAVMISLHCDVTVTNERGQGIAQLIPGIRVNHNHHSLSLPLRRYSDHRSLASHGRRLPLFASPLQKFHESVQLEEMFSHQNTAIHFYPSCEDTFFSASASNPSLEEMFSTSFSGGHCF